MVLGEHTFIRTECAKKANFDLFVKNHDESASNRVHRWKKMPKKILVRSARIDMLLSDIIHFGQKEQTDDNDRLTDK